MHFLNPYGFLTLGFIPILIIIHTLKPKPRQIQVTNLFMWQEAVRESSSHLTFERLRRNLPLILQILVVILAALALAKPSWTYLALKKGNMILVIDTSASMKTRSGSGTRFDQARKKALELIDQRDQGQKILIVEAGAKAVVKDGFLENSNQALTIVKKLRPSDAAVNLEPALYLALSFVDPAKMDLVHLITDGAGENLSTLIKNHPNIRPIIISGGEHNAGITKFAFRQQFDRGDQYEFMLEAKNFNLFPLESA
ncbi:MAG: BatA and WFA domain-containing protein, partial [Deltaproteobacteria bacterium]|nr:BatA and WFA domain-containing protein [Deltaproteobacteria bacterium]